MDTGPVCFIYLWITALVGVGIVIGARATNRRRKHVNGQTLHSGDRAVIGMLIGGGAAILMALMSAGDLSEMDTMTTVLIWALFGGTVGASDLGRTKWAAVIGAIIGAVGILLFGLYTGLEGMSPINVISVILLGMLAGGVIAVSFAINRAEG